MVRTNPASFPKKYEHGNRTLVEQIEFRLNRYNFRINLDQQ